MKSSYVVAFTATRMFAGSAYAQDAMQKDTMAQDSISKDSTIMEIKADNMKNDASTTKPMDKDAMASNYMGKDRQKR